MTAGSLGPPTCIHTGPARTSTTARVLKQRCAVHKQVSTTACTHLHRCRTNQSMDPIYVKNQHNYAPKAPQPEGFLWAASSYARQTVPMAQGPLKGGGQGWGVKAESHRSAVRGDLCYWA